jgi:putative peptidoglycan lipid II flippase
LTLRTPARAAAAGIAGSAALVAVLTLAARLVGFGRVFAFSAAVGAGCTGTAYAAANQVPNVLFEVAAGGALAGAVVPAVSAALARGGPRDADRVASALLTWTVLALVPVSLLLAAVAVPLTGLLLRDPDCTGGADLAARLLVVFAPQVLLYGVGIVLAGVLQAHHRFAGPALAPLLSSVVVIAAYAGYAALAGPAHGVTGYLPSSPAELVLGLGTTLGVLALSLPLLVPARRAGVRLRPALRFPPGAARSVRSLAVAGVAALLAQQAAVVVVLALATRVGGTGAINAYQYAQAVYLLPYAVLAVPVATAAFPRLSRHAADGDLPAFAATSAGTTRGVLVAATVGAAALAAVAPAVQHLFTALDAVGGPALRALAVAVAVFALGLPGWALVAHLGRALYALGRGRAAATATAAGWLCVVAASLVAVPLLQSTGAEPEPAAVVGLAAGNALGMVVAGVLLVLAVRRVAGAAAVAGVAGTMARSGAVAVVAAIVGRLAADAVLAGSSTGIVAAVVAGAVGGAVVLLAAGGALVVVEREAVAPLLRRLRGRDQNRTDVHDQCEAGERAASDSAGSEQSGPITDPRRLLLVLATSGGGTGRHVAELAAGLAVPGRSVLVAGPAATLAALDLPPAVGTVAVEVAVRPRPVADLRAGRRLRALAGRADVVHAHGVRAGALTVLAARTLRRRPAVVVTAHNAAVGGRGVRAVHAVLATVVARGADAVLGVSRDVVADLRGRGARDAERALVPAPQQRPPLRDAATVRAELAVPDGAALLLTVARLAPQKGLDVLADALTRLRERPILAVVAGDGPLDAQLRARADAEELPLRFVGVRRDVPDLLAAADVVVVPSLWEGQSLLVQEALRAGAALVATDAGGTPEVTGAAALLVPPGNPGSLAAAVLRLLDDPGTADALRTAARQRAATLPTASDAVAQVTAVYRRAVARHG